MSTAYKTPGVYIQEISKFPPSIAQVETAIPAFIGYTEKAERNGESMKDKPTLIKSMAEYEAYFGKDAPQKVKVSITGTEVTAVVPDAGKRFYLYDALRMYFANGGGRCYIVSIGSYKDGKVELSPLSLGLQQIAKVDEPTLLLAPDAVSLDNKDLYVWQQQAIAQCAELKDRFTICDLLPADPLKNGELFEDRVTQFRDNIGISELKYGAAYAPWLRTNLPRVFRFRDIVFDSFDLNGQTTDTDIVRAVDMLKSSIKLVNDITTETKTELLTASNAVSPEEEMKKLFEAYTKINPAVANNAARSTALKDLLKYMAHCFLLLGKVKPLAAAEKAKFSDVKLADDLDQWGSATINPVYHTMVTRMITHINAADKAIADNALKMISAPADKPFKEMREFFSPVITDLTATDGTDETYYAGILSAATGGADEKKKAVQDKLRDNLKLMSSGFTGTVQRLLQVATGYEIAFDDALVARFGLYKNLLTQIGAKWNTLPPSGAIAGIYARVDNSRGVWKAPANESLNNVIEPDVVISHADQASMNVDVNAGKSINVIRTFTGKGVLVWGARTLAGNDNEWRYISVRRFFNMVEESTKKATEQFVFEPNDANIWVRVQAMIENYLNTLWRAGALQGAKPEHAYYVNVGLGKTMIPIDILEGRLIIEIGMAVVRPAEFIILRFSHKMAES